MSKIETFKNDIIDFDMFPGAIVNVNYKRKFGTEFNEDVSNGIFDEERSLFLVEESYKCACKISDKEVKLKSEDFENKLTPRDLIDCYYLHIGIDKKTAEEIEKKTLSQVRKK